MAGWFTPTGVFNFPDILRESPQARFALFQQRQSVIVPAYYAMSLTAALWGLFLIGRLRAKPCSVITPRTRVGDPHRRRGAGHFTQADAVRFPALVRGFLDE